MSDSLPFMNSTGLISKILDKIIEAQTPAKYTVDFQSNKLGYGSGSAKPFLPLLKRIGFIGSDGTPTELYKKFRNSSTRSAAMAEGIRTGYKSLYSISEYAHDLDPSKLKDAIIQATGFESSSTAVKAILGTFKALKTYASFDEVVQDEDLEVKSITVSSPQTSERAEVPANMNSRGMNLSYTINLNLPETKDPEVFDAIFTSLKSKLLM